MITKITTCLFLFFLSYTLTGKAQQHNSSPVSKQISPDLFGFFFEDISYAAGLLKFTLMVWMEN